ncbi:MAG: hypothetical protein RLZZ367_1094 [Bacteroidota bacterium]|jgi:hypothetical protein
MDNSFDEVMAKESDAQLIKILTEHRNDYQPAAVEAAEKEFAKRNLSSEKISVAKEKLMQEKQATEAKSGEPLASHWKVLLILLPGVSLIGVAAWALLSYSDGYKQKGRDIVKWTFYGFCMWGGIVALISLLGL